MFDQCENRAVRGGFVADCVNVVTGQSGHTVQDCVSGQEERWGSNRLPFFAIPMKHQRPNLNFGAIECTSNRPNIVCRNSGDCVQVIASIGSVTRGRRGWVRAGYNFPADSVEVCGQGSGVVDEVVILKAHGPGIGSRNCGDSVQNVSLDVGAWT